MASGYATLKSRPLKLVFDIPISRIEKFWQGLKEGKVLATRCRKCGKMFFPPVADCSECYSQDMEWVELSGEGELETFTHILVRPASFQDEEPYTVAIARMKEGVRVLAWIKDVEPTDLKVGMKVKLKADTTLEGEPTYVFVPAE
ncbi:MAG: hypothetical protein DRN96_09090 [Thermoproteota archaeon]|nr:MAG: hypothetical protein DRN96_09090 [Candidatus Korarchaeota archaeon]RLG54126.1 MAG: hypothetical protein DRN99_05645 [Candidatus Korarchaeota archaeon]